MNAPFLYITIFFSLGILLGRFVFLPYVFLVLTAASVVIAFFIYKKDKNLSLFLILPFVFLGAILTGFALNAPNPYERLDGKFITIKGKVCDIKEVEGYAKYVVKPENLPKILITQYGGVYPKKGDIVEVRGIVSLPKSRSNPGGFDYQLFLRKKGIYAVMSIHSYGTSITGRRTNLFEEILWRAQERIKENFLASMPKKDAQFIITSFLGEKVLDDQILTQFRTVGISYITAVAGMQVAIISGFVLYILSVIHLTRYRVFVLLPVLIFYAFLTGLNPPVIRAVVMASITVVGATYGKNKNSINSLSFAAFLILLFNPLMLWDVGFQLSFVATLAILYFYRPIDKMLSNLPSYLKNIIALNLSAQIGTIPFVMYYFHYISFVSFLSNIAIVPLVNIAIILGFLSAFLVFVFPIVSVFVNYINIPFIELLFKLTSFFEKFPYASVNVFIPPVIVIVLYYIVLGILVSGIELRKKKLAVAISFTLVALLFFWNYFMPKDLEVIFLDVGQGDATFVRTPHGRAFLIDGGGNPVFSNLSFDVGEDILLPFLYYKGVMKLDAVFVSHTDIDHVGGIITVLENMKVDRVFIGLQKVEDQNFKKMMEVAGKKRVPVIFLKKGDEVEVDGIKLYVLHPDPDNLIEENPINNNALVFKMTYKNMSFLFTGDIEKPAEEVLKERDLKTHILKVAHHGSSTSSTVEFIEKANPQVFVIQVGKNSYGLPSERVVKYLKERGKVYRTDENGAVIVRTDGVKARIFPFIKGVKE
jgi:competence protein ComEC